MNPNPPEIIRMAAFTDHRDGGNPAGVVLDATTLVDEDMLSIAADLGYSETAFLTPRADRVELRFFSPRAEIAFCGHATIATAVALATREGPGTIDFETPAGKVQVITSEEPDGTVNATLASPPGRSAAAPSDLVGAVLSALRWSTDDLDSTLPPHVAHAGNDHLILNVSARDRLAALDYDFDELREVMDERGLITVHLSWRESTNVFHARDPFPVGGVYEDSATGAAAAAFGAYLNALHGHADRSLTIFQGEDMGRPSTLYVQTRLDSNRIDVTGTAVALDR